MTGINRIKAGFFALCLLSAGFVTAEEESNTSPVAGKVLLAIGNVYSLRGDEKVALKRRSKIMEKDVIHVGANARAQIRMIDSALISLQENSVLKISEYRYNKDDKKDEGNSAFIELLEGGLRTISGKVGKGNKKAYELRTPLATIGIRGTDYEVKVADGGLYVGVWQGAIDVHSVITTNEVVLGREQAFSFVFLNTEGDIKALPSAPSTFSQGHNSGASTAPDKADNNSSNASSANNNSGIAEPQNTSSEIRLPDPIAANLQNTRRAMIINQSTPGKIQTAHTSSLEDAALILDSNGAAIRPNTPATDVEQSIGGYDLNWGRWADTPTSNGSATNSNDDLLWMTYNATSSDIVASKTGTATYNTVTNSITSGSKGAVTNLDVNMDVNFDSGAVTHGVISAQSASDTWVGLFNGQVKNGDLDLQMNSASVINTNTLTTSNASGSIQGDFIGDQAEGVAGAFQMIDDDTHHHVEGAFIVE